MSEPRKVLVSWELAEQWWTRDSEGRRLSIEWGEPDADGFYEPTITKHYDDQLGELDRAWADLGSALPADASVCWNQPNGEHLVDTSWWVDGEQYFAEGRGTKLAEAVNALIQDLRAVTGTVTDPDSQADSGVPGTLGEPHP